MLVAQFNPNGDFIGAVQVGGTSDDAIADLALLPTGAIVAVGDSGSGLTSHGLPSTTIPVRGILWAATTPSAPQDLDVTSSASGSLDIAWSATTGGLSLTAIEVFVNGVLTETLPGTARSTTLTGLTDGETYGIRLRARNVLGASLDSLVVEGVAGIPSRAPGQVRSGSAEPGTGEALLEWLEPEDTGTSPISGYRVQVRVGAEGSWSDLIANTETAELSYLAADLVAGTTYWFRVAALSPAGSGPYSSEFSATPASLSSSPTALQAFGESEEIGRAHV